MVDKTGTLTLGKPTLTGVEAAPGFDQDEVLRLAAALEAGSEHPLADAILRGAEAKGLKPPKVAELSRPSPARASREPSTAAPSLLGNARLMQAAGHRRRAARASLPSAGARTARR